MTVSNESAFRQLHRSLTRRRVFFDLRLRLELVLLALITAAFLFWQARVGFDSLSRARGPVVVAGMVAVIWVLLAVTSGFLTASRHARQLIHKAPGPAWLVLPISPRDLSRHLRWEAGAESRWLLAPGAGILAAAFGLVPLWSVALLGLGLPILLVVADRLGCSIAFHMSLASAEPRPGLAPLIRLLATAARPVSRGPHWRARWRRLPIWAALWSKDMKLGLRSWESRRRLVAAIVIGSFSVLTWTLPLNAAAARLIAFALALIASAVLGEWLVALSGKDPFWILRSVPIGVSSLWSTRVSWGVLWSVTLAAAHALMADPLPPPALELFIGWTGAAALVIVVLAVNYSLTLFPHAMAAQRLFSLALGVAMAVSLMIPLLGWVALLAALLHSARRLPRWSRSEEAT